MTEPLTNEEKQKKKEEERERKREEKALLDRPLTYAIDLQKLKMTAIHSEGTAPILQEAYKKHAAELVSIEDRQHKVSLLILGIFSAGATLIASGLR